MNIAHFLDAQDFVSIFSSTHYLTDWFLMNVLRIGYVFLAIFIIMRDVFFESIFCWVPHMWTGAYREFTHDYCWISNTYRAPMDNPNKFDTAIDKDPNSDQYTFLNYYQWVPLFFLAIIPLLYIPSLVWSAISSISSVSISRHTACFSKLSVNLRSLDPKLKEGALKYLARTCHLLMDLSSQNEQSRMPSRHTIAIVVGIFCYKLTAIIILFLQLFIVQKFLSLKSIWFGWDVFKYMHLTNDVPENGTFPVVTWCPVNFVASGDKIPNFVVHCILPSNVLNVRVFAGIWLILWVGVFLVFIDLIVFGSSILKQMYKSKTIKTKGGCRGIESHILWKMQVEGNASNQSISSDSTNKEVHDFGKWVRRGGRGVAVLKMLRDCIKEDCVWREIIYAVYSEWLKKIDSGEIRLPEKYDDEDEGIDCC